MRQVDKIQGIAYHTQKDLNCIKIFVGYSQVWNVMPIWENGKVGNGIITMWKGHANASNACGFAFFFAKSNACGLVCSIKSVYNIFPINDLNLPFLRLS